MLPALASAATTYVVKRGDTLRKIATTNHIAFSQLLSLNPQIKNINMIYPGQVVTLSKTAPVGSTTGSKTPQPPVSLPPVAVPPVVGTAGESRFVAYTTGYGWPDNTPAGNAISDGIIHSGAGGSGTYADPITLAVGHTISGGKDILDYPAGTKFYIPGFRKYFIVEDTCGDGNSPQNGPCHTGYQGHVWLDLWVGGQGQSSSGTFSCEDAITDLHLVIKNPAANYAVVTGPVYSGSCAKEYGDAVVTN